MSFSDVREPAEHDIVRIPGSILIPQGEFLSGPALASLPPDRPIVVHCKSGARSARVLEALHEAGFADAQHLHGGMLAWIDEVDPNLRRLLTDRTRRRRSRRTAAA